MDWLIGICVRLVRALQKVATRKVSFFILSSLIFVFSVMVLARLDLLPNAPASSAGDAVSTGETAPSEVVSEYPVKIVIPKIDLAASISNPTSTDIELLDKALLSGAVRYPTSVKLGEAGNVLLFGHSSYLPIVNNKVYKTFNGIQKLVPGDIITVYGTNMAYTYKVRSMVKEVAQGSAGIQINTATPVLTLVTCNSFATKDDRFVVTADFVDSHSISSS